MPIHSKLQTWLARDPDPTTREELQTLLDSSGQSACGQDELARRFSGRLKFGTAGLRGVVGAGPGMMNRLVVRETSAGLGTYLLQELPDAFDRGIIVAYDGRLDSGGFARDAACVFAALGITAYLTPDVAATPLAAFGVLALETAAGVVITASHNPPEYNGYKVYWENGAPIIPPRDDGIAAAIDVAATQEIPWIDFDEGRATGKIVLLGPEFYRHYIDTLGADPLYAAASASYHEQPQVPGSSRSISIAYTALHGVGAEIAETLLQEAGFTVYSVAAQREPDGHFPTVKYPNPEEPGAMDAVVALARAQQATLACANDPDADRLAVAARTVSGDYKLLTGDMLGVLLADYLLRQERDFIPIVGTTIVSSGMLERMAKAAGADYHVTLPGFKWLMNLALEQEDQQHRFLFAYEEALGYAAGHQVRDKDGLSALLALAQMTEALAREGKTLPDQLEILYRRHGIYLTGQRSIALPPGTRPPGDWLRQHPPEQIAGKRVLMVDDLGTRRDLEGKAEGRADDKADDKAKGKPEPTGLPPADVLIYHLEHKARVIVRPSGTEPRVKCYYEVVQPVTAEDEFSTAMQRAESSLAELIDGHQREVGQVLGGL